MQNQASILPINKSINFNQESASKESKPNKNKPTEVLPTGRIVFEKQVHLLRAYANAFSHYGRALKTEEVGDVSKTASTTISTANGFFIDVGLIQKNESGFIPSDEVLAFNHAYEWNKETAPSKLIPLFQNTWFAKRLLPKLMMDKLSEEEAITELAAASSASTEYKNQIKLLIDYLGWVGLIRRDGDFIYKGTAVMNEDLASVPSKEMSIQSPPPQNPPSDSGKDTFRAAPSPMSSMTAGAIQFSINVKVDMSEMSGWSGEQISSFFSGIAQVLAVKAAIERERS